MGTIKNLAKVTYDSKNDRWFAENEEYMVLGIGETKQEAIEDFHDNFLYLASLYRELPSNKNIKHGKELKTKFSNFTITGI